MTNPISEPSKSPYIVGEPVSGSDFFDREEILNLIKDFVLSDKRYIFLIHGQRRIGKTSLLRKIFETANREWDSHTVFFNLQGHAQDPVDDLIKDLAKAINDSFPIRNQLSKKHFALISGFYKTYIPKTIQELKNKRLVLLFDEFDTLGTSEFITDPLHRKMAFHAFIPFLEQMLEYLQQQNISVKFIIACGRNYKDLDNDRYGHLFRFARQSEITIFNRLQFDFLIKTAQIHISFQPDAVNLIFKITGGHPMFTQCICDAAFRFAEKNNLLEITSEIVKDVTELVIRQNSSAVLWIWSSLPDKAKIVLYIAAHLPANQNSFSKNSLINQARKFNLLPVTEDLDATLDILICNRFLKYDGEDGNYLFEIEFIHKWILLEINRNSIYKLISVLDEDTELLKANARYSYKKEDWQVCIRYNKDIIKRFQDNYEALSQLMVCFSKINDTDNSFRYFEKASKIDPLVTNDLIAEYKLSFADKITNSRLTKHLGTQRPFYFLGTDDMLQFRYQYPFIPDGLMGRLIDQLHSLVFEKKAWLFGAIFAKNNCIAEVLQQETTTEGLKYISIKVVGRNPVNRRAFLRTIRKQIKYIHENTYPDIECNEMIMCNCSTCDKSDTPNFYELDYIKSNIEAGEKTIFCKIGKQRVTIEKILHEIYANDELFHGKDMSANKIFISYSTADRYLRKIFEQRLKVYLASAKNRFGTVWSDVEIRVGGDWNKEIQKALQESNIGILLVSPSFLGSKYCMGDEFKQMLDRRKSEGYTIVPVLLRECNFQNIDDLKTIQFVKTYQSEYDVTDLLKKDKLMPFDELAEIPKPQEMLLNRYFLKVSAAIDLAIGS